MSFVLPAKQIIFRELFCELLAFDLSHSHLTSLGFAGEK